MNIGIDIRSIGKKRTGDEVYMTELVQGLSKLDIGHTIILFTDTEDWRSVGWLRNLPANMKIISIRPTHKLLWTMYALPKACQEYDIDLLHVMYITPLFALPEKTRLITTIHDISWKVVPEYIRRFDKFALNLLIPLSLRRADHILTVSEHEKKAIHKTFSVSKEKITAIYNGGFVQNTPTIFTLSSKVQTIIQSPYILYLGSLQPRKNLPNLIRAFSLYRKNQSKSKVKLIIAGGKGHNYDDRIDQALDESPVKHDILMPGFVSEEEKYALLKHAQAFVFISFYEGFGIPPIEAMSCKTPVIVSNASCMPEIAGDGGLAVNPQDVSEIAEAINGIVHNQVKAKQLSEQGYERAKMFTWDSMVEHTYQVYKELLLNT